jgi:hypothetical protein
MHHENIKKACLMVKRRNEEEIVVEPTALHLATIVAAEGVAASVEVLRSERRASTAKIWGRK